mmetsp:Transcript_88701/g.237213  ORF Transcript_88701/g.237213 Transcript_88701/m.237213 type:complete len:250 (+) Transcript_88701:1401-2150(+)
MVQLQNSLKSGAGAHERIDVVCVQEIHEVGKHIELRNTGEGHQRHISVHFRRIHRRCGIGSDLLHDEIEELHSSHLQDASMSMERLLTPDLECNVTQNRIVNQGRQSVRERLIRLRDSEIVHPTTSDAENSFTIEASRCQGWRRQVWIPFLIRRHTIHRSPVSQLTARASSPGVQVPDSGDCQGMGFATSNVNHLLIRKSIQLNWCWNMRNTLGILAHSWVVRLGNTQLTAGVGAPTPNLTSVVNRQRV